MAYFLNFKDQNLNKFYLFNKYSFVKLFVCALFLIIFALVNICIVFHKFKQV